MGVPNDEGMRRQPPPGEVGGAKPWSHFHWTPLNWPRGGQKPSNSNQRPQWTDGIKAMSRGFSGGKQVINSFNTRNRGRVCLFFATENEQLFILETIMVNYGWKWSFLLFLDSAATVDVLTASNNDVNFVETQTVHFARPLNHRFVLRE